jgi:hypothetical protein
MIKKFIKILLVILAFLTLSACDPAEDEAKKLGFDDLQDMRSKHAQGWHTKAQFYEDNYKKNGFANAIAMKTANDNAIVERAKQAKVNKEAEAKQSKIAKMEDTKQDSSSTRTTQKKSKGSIVGVDKDTQDLVEQVAPELLEEVNFKTDNNFCIGAHSSDAVRYGNIMGSFVKIQYSHFSAKNMTGTISCPNVQMQITADFGLRERTSQVATEIFFQNCYKDNIGILVKNRLMKLADETSSKGNCSYMQQLANGYKQIVSNYPPATN